MYWVKIDQVSEQERGQLKLDLWQGSLKGIAVTALAQTFEWIKVSQVKIKSHQVGQLSQGKENKDVLA